MLRRTRTSPVARRPLAALFLGLCTAAASLVMVGPTTSAVPLEPAVLADSPSLDRHDRFTDNSGRMVYVTESDDIRIFDPTDLSDRLLVDDHTPNFGRLPTLIGDDDERLLYEHPAGTVNSIPLSGGAASEFFVVPPGGSIETFQQGFGDGDNVMVIDLGDGQKELYLFGSDVAVLPAPLATFEAVGSVLILRVLPDDGGVAIERRVGTERVLTIVTAGEVDDIASPVLLPGSSRRADGSYQLHYLTGSFEGPVDLWVVALPDRTPVKVLTHPDVEYPQFDRGGDGIAMGTTVYSRSGAFDPWSVPLPTPPDGYETSASLYFSDVAGQEVVARIDFRPLGGGSWLDGGSLHFELAGTEPVLTVPPAEPEQFADDVYDVRYDFSASAGASALALLVEEPGGTFGIRYRPAGGSEADEIVIDSGATVRFDRSEVRFDDGGFRLGFVRNSSALHFVSLLDQSSVEVQLEYETADFYRTFDFADLGSPGDVIIIEDRCDIYDADETCTSGSRLMYVELPSIWIDPTLQSVVPARVLETRTAPDAKTVDGEFEGVGRIGAGKSLELGLFGRNGIDVPSTASAVLLNVVAVRPSGVGFLTLYPCGAERPLAANVNYTPGGAAANAVLAKLGDGGKVCIYSEAETDVVVDVNGYVPFGGDNTAVDPARIYESRSIADAETIDGKQEGVGRLGAGDVARVNIAGRAGVPSGIADGFYSGSAYLNVVAIRPSANGYLTVFPCTEERPLSANVNYSAGGVAPNAVLARLSPEGDVCIYSSAEVDIVVDVNGYVDPFSATSGITPGRFLETRRGDGLETIDGEFEGIGRLGAGDTLALTIHERRSESDRPGAVFLNIVAVGPATNGYITVFPCDAERPLAANVNYTAGKIGYNAVFAKVGSGGKVCLYSSAETDLVVDVNGLVYG